MNNNYLLLIIIFTLLIYFLYNNQHDNRSIKSPEVELNKDKFDDTMTINNYLNSKTLELKKEKNFNEESVVTLDKFKKFNNNFEKYNESIQNNITDYKTSLENDITNISQNVKNYDYSDIDEFYKIYEDNYPKPIPTTIDEHFTASIDKTQEKNENIFLDTFLGTYSVLPYQYNNLNLVYFVISKIIPEKEDQNLITPTTNNNTKTNVRNEKYIMGIYIKNILIQEYIINFEKINEKSSDNSDNIKGITVLIKDEIPLVRKPNMNEVEVENIKDILFNLGFTDNSQFHLFLVNSRFDKRYLTANIKGKVDVIEYQKNNDDLFRIYSTKGTTILHLKKKQLVDKPFESLLS